MPEVLPPIVGIAPRTGILATLWTSLRTLLRPFTRLALRRTRSGPIHRLGRHPHLDRRRHHRHRRSPDEPVPSFREGAGAAALASAFEQTSTRLPAQRDSVFSLNRNHDRLGGAPASISRAIGVRPASDCRIPLLSTRAGAGERRGFDTTQMTCIEPRGSAGRHYFRKSASRPSCIPRSKARRNLKRGSVVRMNSMPKLIRKNIGSPPPRTSATDFDVKRSPQT